MVVLKEGKEEAKDGYRKEADCGEGGKEYHILVTISLTQNVQRIFFQQKTLHFPSKAGIYVLLPEFSGKMRCQPQFVRRCKNRNPS